MSPPKEREGEENLQNFFQKLLANDQNFQTFQIQHKWNLLNYY
jgi:hypothetical protein